MRTLQSKGFLNELRHAPATEQEAVLRALREVLKQLKELIYIDAANRAFLNDPIRRAD